MHRKCDELHFFACLFFCNSVLCVQYNDRTCNTFSSLLNHMKFEKDLKLKTHLSVVIIIIIITILVVIIIIIIICLL